MTIKASPVDLAIHDATEYVGESIEVRLACTARGQRICCTATALRPSPLVRAVELDDVGIQQVLAELRAAAVALAFSTATERRCAGPDTLHGGMLLVVSIGEE